MWQGAWFHNTYTWNALRSSFQANVKGFELSPCLQFKSNLHNYHIYLSYYYFLAKIVHGYQQASLSVCLPQFVSCTSLFPLNAGLEGFSFQDDWFHT